MLKSKPYITTLAEQRRKFYEDIAEAVRKRNRQKRRTELRSLHGRR